MPFFSAVQLAFANRGATGCNTCSRSSLVQEVGIQNGVSPKLCALLPERVRAASTKAQASPALLAALRTASASSESKTLKRAGPV